MHRLCNTNHLDNLRNLHNDIIHTVQDSGCLGICPLLLYKLKAILRLFKYARPCMINSILGLKISDYR